MALPDLRKVSVHVVGSFNPQSNHMMMLAYDISLSPKQDRSFCLIDKSFRVMF